MIKMLSRLTVILFLLHCNLYARQYGWTVLATPRPAYQMKAVEFKDSLHGWCDAGGLLFRTTDGGHNWDTCAQPYPTNGILDISFSDTLHGWAVATIFQDEARIWRTIDGGKTWTEKLSENNRQFVGTAALDTVKNISVGYNFGYQDTGRIVATTNGGQLWTESTFADSVTRLGKIQFVDSLHGWIAGAVYDPSKTFGGRAVLFRTTDGGIVWTLIDKPIYQYFSFVDSLNGFAFGGRNNVGSNEGNYILRTRDGGLTWDSTFVFDSTVYNDQISLTGISFIDTLNGWLFGGIFYQGGFGIIIIRTSDGGKTWTPELVGPGDGFGDVIMIDKHHGWAVTLDSKVMGYELLTGVVEHLPQVPRGFVLRQNYPNPFNPSTVIEYEIPRESSVRIAIYDEVGKLVTTLVQNHQKAGVYRIRFDASGLATGLYLCRMETGTFLDTKRLLFLK